MALSRSGRDGEARYAALTLAMPDVMSPTSLTAYQSRGRLLIVGPGPSVRMAAEGASDNLAVTMLITDDAKVEPASEDADQPAGKEVRKIYAEVSEIRGYLGQFQVDTISAGEVHTLAPSVLTGNQPYDLIMDLGRTPKIRSEVLPPGYFAPGRDGERIQQDLDSMADLVGEFEKPLYVQYNPDICAHGASGLSGCTRCLDNCPSDSILSIGERIEVDTHLCHGIGSCATSCPTGAIRYAYPVLPDLMARVQVILKGYINAGGETPCVLLHDTEVGRERLLAGAAGLPENCLPFELEEIASVGLESWLSILAFGACGVAVLCHEKTPASVKALLVEQMGIAEALLTGLGYPSQRVVLLDGSDSVSGLAGLAEFDTPLLTTAAHYQVLDEKRTTIRQALDHLYALAPEPQSTVDLPASAPFGEIQVDPSTCTLCMSCASVCPAGAVLAGGELPQLNFVEQNCVQCGLCATACPENSITLAPRMLFPVEERSRRRLLNEDQPFHCLRCNVAFASTRTIESILEKLAGHWMYQEKPEQLRRLKMCDECRVKDMFENDGQMLDVRKD